MGVVDKVPRHSKLMVKFMAGRQLKIRRPYHLTGCSPRSDVCIFSNSSKLVYRAVLERVLLCKDFNGDLTPPPCPKPGLFEKRIFPYLEKLSKYAEYCTPMTSIGFANSYQGPKRRIYTRAAQSLDVVRLAPRDARSKIFPKYEKYNTSDVPRIISPRDPRYTVENGRYLKPIEPKIYNSLTQLIGHKCVFKGLNQIERGTLLREHWDHFDDPVAIPMDQSRYDAHHHALALKFEHGTYAQYYPHDRYFKWILSLQINNRCSYRSATMIMSYVTTSRLSGDYNTSLGNCLMNVILVYEWCQSRAIDVRLADDGDDIVAIIEKRDLARYLDGIVEYYLDLGFHMKVEKPVFVFEHISFCQTSPVKLPIGWLMVRTPQRAIVRDSVSLEPLEDLKFKNRWLASVGIGGLSCNAGVPVMQAYYSMLARNSHGAKVLKDYSYARVDRQLKLKYMDVSAESRVSFWLAFGVTPNEQEVIETYYNNLILGDVHDHGVVNTQLPI